MTVLERTLWINSGENYLQKDHDALNFQKQIMFPGQTTAYR